MSKAILVLDMPQSCDVCPFVKMIGNNFICTPRENDKKVCSVYYHVMNNIKPDYCPLRELPEERYFCTGEVSEYDNGWNDCLLELAKMGGK